MICPKCGRENPDDSLFCNKCGNRFLPQEARWKCPNCGAWNPTFVAFCQNCAKEMPAAVSGTAPERYCAWCGAGVMLKDLSCPRCGHDPSGPIKETLQAAPVSQKPMIAGILMIGAGLLDLVSGTALLMMAKYPTDLPFDISGTLQCCGGAEMFFGVTSMIGGFFAFQRRHFVLSLIAAALGMIGAGPFYLGFLFGLIGLILLALSRDSFID